ncbi:hypothetical protein RFI_29216, partial [Reticulomyxa filosa]
IADGQTEIEVWDIDDDDDDDDDDDLPEYLKEQHAKHSTDKPLSMLTRMSHQASAIRLTNLGVPREKRVSQNPMSPTGLNNMLASPFHVPTSPFGLAPVSPQLFKFPNSRSSIGSATGFMLSPSAFSGSERKSSLVMSVIQKKGNTSTNALLSKTSLGPDNRPRKTFNVKSTPVTPKSGRTSRRPSNDKDISGRELQTFRSSLVVPMLPVANPLASKTKSQEDVLRRNAITATAAVVAASSTTNVNTSNMITEDKSRRSIVRFTNSSDVEDSTLSPKRPSKTLSRVRFDNGMGDDNSTSKRESTVRVKRTTVAPQSARASLSKSQQRKSAARKTQYVKRSILKGIGLNRESTNSKQRRSIFFDSENVPANTSAAAAIAAVNANNVNPASSVGSSGSALLHKGGSIIGQTPSFTGASPSGGGEHLRGGSGFSDMSFARWMRGKTIDNMDEAEDPPFWENDRGLYGALMSVQIVAEFMNEYKASSECRAKFMKMVKYFTRFVKNHTYHKNWSNKKFYDKAKAKLHDSNYNLFLYEHYLASQKYFARYQANLKKKKIAIPKILPPPPTLQAQPWNWVSLTSRSANIGLSTLRENEDDVSMTEGGRELSLSSIVNTIPTTITTTTSAPSTTATTTTTTIKLNEKGKPNLLKKMSIAFGRRGPGTGTKDKDAEQEPSHSRQESFIPFSASPLPMEREHSASHSIGGGFAEELVEMFEAKIDDITKELHYQMNEEFTLEIDPVHKVGFCYTKNYSLKSKSKQWKNRYFMVRGRLLFRYTLKDDENPLDLINCHAKAFDLEHVKVEVHEKVINYNGVNLYPFTLHFVSPFDNVNNKPAQQEHKQFMNEHPPLHLACSSASDRDGWVEKLKVCSQLYRNKNQDGDNEEVSKNAKNAKENKNKAETAAADAKRDAFSSTYQLLFLGNDIIIICDRSELFEDGNIGGAGAGVEEKKKEEPKGHKRQPTKEPQNAKKNSARPTFLGGLFAKGQDGDDGSASNDALFEEEDDADDGEDDDEMLQRDFSEFYKLKFVGAIHLMEIVT